MSIKLIIRKTKHIKVITRLKNKLQVYALNLTNKTFIIWMRTSTELIFSATSIIVYLLHSSNSEACNIWPNT